MPPWADDPKIGSRMINARSETVATKPAFRAAFRRRRCVLLADGFYEWTTIDGERHPRRIRREDKGLFLMAGLWERWAPPSGEPLETFTILTVEADDLVRPLHDRRPVVLPPDAAREWLDPEIQDPKRLSGILATRDDAAWTIRPVDRCVNAARYSGEVPEI